jgi:hypothetical protein
VPVKAGEEDAAIISDDDEPPPPPPLAADPEEVDASRIISEYQRGFNEARLEFGSSMVATPARKMSARAKGRVRGRYMRLGPDTSEWDAVDIAEADQSVVAKGMEQSVLLSLTSLSLEGAGSVLREALVKDQQVVHTKWNEEEAVLAVVGYTYAALMFERLLQMGQITGPNQSIVHQKIKNSQLRKEELSSMVDGAALRAALDAAEQHWFVGRLRAGVVPGQIAQQARQYQAQKRRFDASAAVTAAGTSHAAPVLIPVAGAPLDGVVLRRWFSAAKAGEMVALRTMVGRWPPLLTIASAGVGNTALHWAAAKGHASAVRLLIQSGAPVEQRNESGATPLHSAAANGQLPAARALLSAGAHHAVADYAEQTPHTAALSRGWNDVAKLIAHFGLARQMSEQRQRGAPSFSNGQPPTMHTVPALHAPISLSSFVFVTQQLVVMVCLVFTRRRGLVASRSDRPAARRGAGCGRWR